MKRATDMFESEEICGGFSEVKLEFGEFSVISETVFSALIVFLVTIQ